ncbi:MAG TPA: ATP-binding protein, partial [Acidimicrobiia bacterium]|nr:ATP-binding protein [Acidimicrobiia bacterium]
MRALVSWSSGKDSAWALHSLREEGVEVVGLVTTVNQETDRVSMQGVRRSLLTLQAGALGLPVWEVALPWPCSNEEYQRRMGELIERAEAASITHIAFGDLFLDDVRSYREEMLAPTSIEPLFP